MTTPWAKEGSPLSGPISEDSEIDALQTDVMRFMAILGFILSVIFALVQSLPFTPEDPHPKLEHAETLQSDITNLKIHIQSQLEILANIRNQIREWEAYKKKSLSDLKRILDHRTELLADTETIFEKLTKSQNQVTTTEHQLKTQKKSLRTLRLSIERERQKLQQLQNDIARVRKNVLKVQQQQKIALENAKTARLEVLKTQKSKQPKREKRQIAKPVLPPKRVGFVLKFESDEAFKQLLAADRVKFYVFIGDKAWRIKLSGKIANYITEAKPKRYHEMDQATVPKLFITGFKKVVAAYGRHSHIWGVILPASLSQQIQTKIKNKRGGDLIISGTGRVRLENSNL